MTEDDYKEAEESSDAPIHTSVNTVKLFSDWCAFKTGIQHARNMKNS